MALLPELDSEGFIKKEREEVTKAMPTRKRKRLFRTMDWINLLEKRCPLCGEKLKNKRARYSCDFNNCTFSIAEFKMVKIVRDLRAKEEMRFPF